MFPIYFSGENSSSLPATLPSMMSAPSPVQTPAPVAYHGEQLTSMLPITVPGATADAFNVNQSFPSSKFSFKDFLRRIQESSTLYMNNI